MNQQESIKDFMSKWADKRMRSYIFRQQYDGMFNEIDTFLRGEQWNNANQSNTWQSRPVTNYSHKIQQAKVAVIAEKDMSIILKPLFEDDIKAADTLQRVVQSYWEHSGIKEKIDYTKLDSRGFPVGYAKILFDGSVIVGTENNLQLGDFNVSVPKPMNIYWEPKAYDYKELNYIYETKIVSLKELKETKGYNQDVIADAEDYIESVRAARAANGDEASEVLNRNYDLVNDEDGNPEFVLYEIHYRWKPSPAADFKYGIIHTISAGTTDEDTVEQTPLWSKADLGTNGHAIIPLYEFKYPHEFIGRSTVQLTLDNQKQINKVDSIIATAANQAQNNQKIVAQDSGIDPAVLAKYGAAAGLVLVTKTDINNSVKYLEPAKISQELIGYKREKKEDMMDVAGVTAASLGQNAGSVTTSAGVNSLIAQSQGIDAIPKTNYKIFLKHIISRMIELIVKNGKKVQRRIDNKDPNKDEEYSFIEFDPAEMKGKQFDISVDIRMTEAEKQRQKQEVMQLLSLQASMGTQILTNEDIVDLMDFPDKDRFLANMAARKEQEKNETDVQIGQIAAMIMAQEIQDHSSGNDSVSIQDMAQLAATEAVKRVKQEKNGIKAGGSPAGAAGAAAPQPNAMAAGQGNVAP